jgi:hypothetical protein
LKITKALIIADPWIGFLLDGSKTWEMRSTGASHRGWFGLIRKGTGAVYGVARLVDVGHPLTPSEMILTFAKHRIPEAMIRSGEVSKWNTPWCLTDIRCLPAPVAYNHKSGAVTWVQLDSEVSRAIEHEMVDATEVRPDTQAHKPLMSRVRISPDTDPVMPASETHPSQPESQLVLGTTELTQGNIDNSHIYLREFFDRFPGDAVGGSNRSQKANRNILVDWGGTSLVETDLDGTKRLFRARGWIKRFLEMNAADAGDSVLVEQTGPYSYRVRLEKMNGTRE